MTFETISFSVADNVAHLALNRPEVGNAVNQVMAAELVQVARTCRDDSRIRAVLLSASGPIFCAGADLAYLKSLGTDVANGVRTLAVTTHEALFILSTMDAPVVGAVQGMALGGGFAFAMMPSIVVASEKARFAVGYLQAGLSPDCGLTYFLPRHVGMRVAEELMLSNRIVGAPEAQALGMVNEVVVHDLLLDHAYELAQKLAAGPTRAYGAARRLLLQSLNNSLQEQLELEAETVAAVIAGEGYQEIISALVGKRKPDFKS